MFWSALWSNTRDPGAALAALLSTSPVTPFLDGAAFATISATSDPTLSQEAARAIVASKTKGAASTLAAVPLAPVEEPAADADAAADATKPAEAAPAKAPEKAPEKAPAKKAPAKKKPATKKKPAKK